MRPLNAFAGFCLFMATAMVSTVSAQCPPDSEAPVISNTPANITMTAEPGLCGATVTWTIPQASDNCEVTSFSADQVPNDFYAVGHTMVNYTALDAAGNMAATSFTITITDDEDPTLSNMPEDISVDNDSGQCDAVVTWTAPTGNDNCGIASLTSDYNSGDTFDVGTTTVTYTLTDVNGNSITDSFDIIVTDNENPTATAQDVTLTLDASGMASTTAAAVNNGSTDNCSIATTTLSQTDFDCTDLGANTVTLTVTDIHSNQSTATATITVQDNQDPVIAQMTGINVNNDATNCSAVVTWTDPAVTENCTYTLTPDTASGSTFEVGVTTVTYTAEDAAGNSATMSFDITVLDNEKPVISGTPASFSQTTDADVCTAVVTWTEPTATDNCTLQDLDSDHEPGDTFDLGETLVTYTATDIYGNQSTTSFTITVTDGQNPTVDNTPADISVNNDTGNCSAVVTWTAPTAGDNCSATIAQTDGAASGTAFDVGTHTIEYTATDAAGNTATDTFTITVSDSEDPTINDLPANITQDNDAELCSAIVSWTAPTAADNCAGMSIAQTAGGESGSAFDVGTHTITYTATDAAGNTHAESFTITISDSEAPLIGNLYMETFEYETPYDANDLCATDNIYTPDDANWSLGPACSVTTNGIPKLVDVAGDTHLEYNQKYDANSEVWNSADMDVTNLNSVQVSLDIRSFGGLEIAGNAKDEFDLYAVLDGSETSVVSFDGHVDGTSSANGVTKEASFSESVDVSGASNLSLRIKIKISGGDGSESYQVNDIEVNYIPGDIAVNNDSGNCSAVVTWTAPEASDNCTGSTISQTAGNASGSAFDVGSHTITYTATDAAGNTSTQSFNITVSDDEDPTIENTPENVTQDNDAGSCGAVVTWTAPTAADNCTATISQTGGAASGTSFAVGTTHTIEYTATDDAGNTATDSFTITVNDTEDPTISDLPADITTGVDAGDCSAIVNWTAPTADDNCSATIAQTAGDASGSTFDVGTHTITYTATDGAGNTFSDSFTITVNDDENPSINNLPADITEDNDTDACGAVVTWVAPTASDNCAGQSIAQTGGDASGSTFTVGSHTITYTATDAAGNTTTETFTITVNDSQNPSASGMPENMTVNNATGTCGAVVTWVAPTASDNCAGATISQTGGDASGSTFAVGSHTITYTITDAASNSATDSFTITVNDTENPTVDNTPADISVNNDTGNCSAVVTWTAPTAGDNCSATIAQTGGDASGSTFAVGTHTITYTATDGASNTATDSFTITVSDSEKPTINGLPSNITQDNDPGLCGAIISWTEPTTEDNCAGATISQTAGGENGSIFTVGTHTITYTATDAASNTETGSFTITISDNEDPVIGNLYVETFEYETPYDADDLCATGNIYTPDDANWSLGPACSVTTNGIPKLVDVAGDTHLEYNQKYPAGSEVWNSADIDVTNLDSVQVSLDIRSFGGLEIAGNAKDEFDLYAVLDGTETSVVSFDGHVDGTSSANGVTKEASFSESVDVSGASNLSLRIKIKISGGDGSESYQVNDIEVNYTPGDIAVNNDSGNCSAVVNWAAPNTNDNCSATISQTAGSASGSAFDVGTHTITYTATDDAGNSSTFSFDITVADDEDPTVENTPENITQDNDDGDCGAVVTWTAPTAADNCTATISQTGGAASGTSFAVGTTHTIEYTATDDAGNTSTDSFTITVNDTEDPTISDLPADITTGVDAGDCSAIVNWTAPTADDNCSATIAQTAGDASGSTFNVGTHTITYTATDGAGNTFADSFTITVNDDEDPSISGTPADINQDMDSGSCDAVVTWTAPTGSDNCSQTLTSTHDSGDTFGPGATTVTYTSEDAAGNTVTSTFTVTITDNEAPTITDVPADINLTPDQGECTADATWVDADAEDNCSVTSFSSDYNSGDSFNIGTTEVTFTATDAAGNTTTATFNVIVTDNDFDVDGTGDCSDDDIDNDGRDNDEDSDDFDNSVCADTDNDGCDDCSQGGEDSFDPANDGPDSDGDGICDDGDNCSDPLANNYLDPANGECENCPNAPIFDSIYYTLAATTLSSADGAIALDISGNAADTLFLTGINGAPDYTITLPDALDDLEAGYYIAQIQDSDGCWGVADTSVGGTTLQQPAIQLEVIIPFTLCCSGCGINDIDADGLCDDDDNCTDQRATNFDDSANGPCIIAGCTDSNFTEYDAAATQDDGSCATAVVEGCTDPAYDEYDPSANTDDGSCLTSSCATDADSDGLCDDVDLCWFTGACNYDYNTYGNVACIVPDAGACETCSGGVAVGDNTPPTVLSVTWPADYTTTGICGFGTCEAATAANSANAGIPTGVTWDDDCGVGSDDQSFEDGPQYDIVTDDSPYCGWPCDGYSFDRTWTITATDDAGNTATQTHVQTITVTVPE